MNNSLAVQLLTKEDYGANAHAAFIPIIKHLLLQDWQVCIQHIYREGNKRVNWLANAGFSLQMSFHPYAQVRDDLQQFLTDDS